MADHGQDNYESHPVGHEGGNTRQRGQRFGLSEHWREQARKVVSDELDDDAETSPTPDTGPSFSFPKASHDDEPPATVKSLFHRPDYRAALNASWPSWSAASELSNEPGAGGMGFFGARQIPKQSRHDRQVADVMSMLQGKFYLTYSESRSPLLIDKATGETLPYMDPVILERVKGAYWRASSGSQQDVSYGVIKSAISNFVDGTIPGEVIPVYGRAGVDLNNGRRALILGSHCLVFSPGLSSYEIQSWIPHVMPRESLPVSVPDSIGNVCPQSISTLFDVTSLPKDSDLLVIAWMVMAWRSDSAPVLLELLGEPTPELIDSQKMLKMVIDPASSLFETEVPKTIKQVDIRAQCHYLMSFHRVDSLSKTQQKGLLSIMQGKAVEWRTKTKRSGVDLFIRCVVMLNSSESVVTYSPLSDATLSIELDDAGVGNPQNAVKDRSMAERTIIHGLLQIFGHVNQFWGHVENDRQFDRYGGLRDLCRIGVLVADALGRDTAEFWKQLDANQQSRRDYELEENPVAMAVKRLIDASEDGRIEATVKDWLVLLDGYRPESDPSGSWPVTSRGLAAKFKQSRALLATFGIQLVPLEKRGPYGRWRASCDASRQQ
ncbi:hypothetical protein EQG41_05045 [Billgrantia azerbaijanica]|nr:hypothetical protein EQG41_05045 [Halomonas azerbaijanica]